MGVPFLYHMKGLACMLLLKLFRQSLFDLAYLTQILFGQKHFLPKTYFVQSIFGDSLLGEKLLDL